jgi:hypothetical protein
MGSGDLLQYMELSPGPVRAYSRRRNASHALCLGQAQRILSITMVLRATHGSSSFVISFKPHSLAVGRDDTCVVSWDLGGRLYSSHQPDSTWRRGLSGHMLKKCSGAAGRSRGTCSVEEADAVVDAAARFAKETVAAIGSADWRWLTPLEPVVAQLVVSHLNLSAQFDSAHARADIRRFATVYSPVGILPPDQYLSLVVQATEGCAFNTCTFCDLYHDGYRVKSSDQFRAHVADVRAYLGASVSLRSRGIFLGAANALAVPMATLLDMFEILVEELDAIPRGVCTFVDGFTGARKSVADYRRLGDLGLRRVYVGMESGHDPLLAWVRKPGVAADALETVTRLKAGGLQVGVIVLTGLGGDRFAGGHVRDTIDVIARMGLGDGDLVYFSELVEAPATSYPRLATACGVESFAPDRCRAQRDAIRDGIRAGGSSPSFATYDVREFVY